MFKGTMSFKNRIVQLSDGDVMQRALLRNTLEYDTSFQSTGVAGSTIM